MLKIIRQILYGLAISIGMLGLVIGGDPLVKYALEMLHNYESQYYYDTHYLNEPEIIILLSLILLVGVCIAIALDKGIRPSNPPNAVASAQSTAIPNNAISRPPAPPETSATPVETPDEKLTRLLTTRKD